MRRPLFLPPFLLLPPTGAGGKGAVGGVSSGGVLAGVVMAMDGRDFDASPANAAGVVADPNTTPGTTSGAAPGTTSGVELAFFMLDEAFVLSPFFGASTAG